MTMTSPRSRNRAILFALACALTGCKPDAPAHVVPPAPKAKPRKDLTITLPEGRKVDASVPEPSSINGENGAVMIFSEGHRITIGVGRVMVDGAEMLQMPAETKHLGLNISDTGLLTVNRDDAKPATLQLSAQPETK